jgi:hypothetical protein
VISAPGKAKVVEAPLPHQFSSCGLVQHLAGEQGAAKSFDVVGCAVEIAERLHGRGRSVSARSPSQTVAGPSTGSIGWRVE